MKRLSILALYSMVATPAIADIASTSYVDSIIDSLATVATSGSYNDLNDKPTIPTVPTNISSFNNDSGYITNSYHDSTKQDRLPQWPGGAGKYRLVVNTYTGQLGWEFEQFSLTCPTGTYDIGFEQCVDPAAPGTARGFISHGGQLKDGDATYGLTENGTWATEFSYGIMKGIASCNSTPGTSMGEVKPGNTFTQDSKGQYCWCKMTSPSASGWVSRNVNDNADNCAAVCAVLCADGGQRLSGFRFAVVSAVGQ